MSSDDLSFHSSAELADRVVLPAPVAGPDECREATDVIESDHEAIRAKAAELTSGLETDLERAKALFAFVRDAIAYDFTPDLRERADWSASRTLARGYGFCQQKAVLFAALSRAAAIPSAISFQRIVDHKLLDTRFEKLLPGGVITFHGLSFLWIGGRWRPADATLDAGLCGRRHYRLTELDPEGLGRLPATDLEGAPHFDILKEMGPFSDMPRGITDLATSMPEAWSGLRELAKRLGATM